MTGPGLIMNTTRSFAARSMGALRLAPLLLLALSGAAQAVNLTAPPSLKHTQVPEPPNLGDFVKDRKAAITLGKALFWDMQVGSDGMQACATCHFHAGADHRTKNTVNPGGNGTFELVPGPNSTLTAANFPFHRLASVDDRSSAVLSDVNDIGGSQGVFDGTFELVAGPNSTLTAANFPFHRLADVDDPYSAVLQDVNDISGSQGVFDGTFLGVVRDSAVELGAPLSDPVYHVGSNNTRRVTGRNAPSVINAVFNYNNFWDGRANFVFNGVNPFGDADQGARIFSNDGWGSLMPVAVHIENASLASQAVGPPGSDVEMSLARRTFPDIGKKLLALRPLDKQLVHASDSVLGPLARSTGRSARTGLSVSYATLIKQAFKDPLWNAGDQVVAFDSLGFHLVPRPSRLA
ncbi:MAG TPA: cytochrome c peroxidase, partial [Gemmatimonadales bacterium]